MNTISPEVLTASKLTSAPGFPQGASAEATAAGQPASWVLGDRAGKGWARLAWLRGLRYNLWFWRVRSKLGACGERVFLPRNGNYQLENLFFGNDVEIGSRSILWAAHSKIVFGDKVMSGPEIVIMAGDHNMRLLGKFMRDVGEEEKGPGDDLDVVIEGDVWIGTRAVILKGVHIGRGAIIGAGAIVRRRVPPYGIAVGNPARVHRLRGSLEEIMAHEAKLYPPEKRLSRGVLETIAAVVYRAEPGKARV